MMASTVAVALGQSSDITAEAAGLESGCEGPRYKAPPGGMALSFFRHGARDIAAVLNALRVAIPSKNPSDF